MIRFQYIPNKERFMSLIEKSHGSVLLHLPDQSTRDLKCDSTALQMLYLLPPNPMDLCLSFSDCRDSSRFLRYMMEAVHG
ncbi:MAG: hypothetical protein HFI29_08355 [Lachnospiraceae bacterium]|jgi:hypothetical protein|nr:hypothetical protein [Lachnospiraceae bacterium]